MNTPAWFDEPYYLASKLAQLRAVAPETYNTLTPYGLLKNFKGFGFPAYDHFLHFGDTEQVNPTEFFNAEEYFEAKLEQLNTDKEQGRSDWTIQEVKEAFSNVNLSAWEHYQIFGDVEDVNPSNAFDEDAYFEAKAEQLNTKGELGKTDWNIDQVKQAFLDAGLNAVEHYLLWGKSEGIQVSKVANGNQVAPDTVMPSIRLANGCVIDGRIKDATVFAELDGDGFKDANEPSFATDKEGNFDGSFTGLAANAPLVAKGGIDIATNLPFSEKFTAPAGSAVITPLTTLIETLIESGISEAAAKANVKEVFDLPDNIQLQPILIAQPITALNLRL